MALCLVGTPAAALAAPFEPWRDTDPRAGGSGTMAQEAETLLPPAPLPEPVQLAQSYDFDVYVDQYGREIIVDAYTGEVVEIRPPAGGVRRPPPRPREFDGQVYDFSNPREVERYRRDRRPPPVQRAPVDPYVDRSYDREPDYRDRNVYREAPSYGEDGIERAPLDAPSRGEDFASVPEEESGIGLGSGETVRRPTLPGESAVVTLNGASEEVAGFQVLLDRAGASPGVIDGRMGDNVNKAISAYREITGQTLKTYDREWIKAELERTGGPALQDYTITAEDAAGPFIASVPPDYSHKAQLDALSYTSVSEMLAERFHMDEKYLLALNPGVTFNRPGTVIKVANPGSKNRSKVARVVADKAARQVRLYGERGELVGAYPATIGSSDTPSPSGTHSVARVALNPEYTYNPKINFKQGANDKVLKIPPGPNGPVGSVWIALSKPTYGIHGTPDPSKIGKTASHGCVRLTNWDAEELAKRVKAGVTVEFEE